jgi:hypothetical protein
MPKLTFDDVFLAEKSDVVEKIMSLQKQLQFQSIIITNFMIQQGIRTVTVVRKEFVRNVEEAGLEEPVTMTFSGGGDSITLEMGEPNNDNTNSW